MTEMLKGEKHRKVVWTENARLAFTQLKKDLLENVVLNIANPGKPFVLQTDASDYAVGQYDSSMIPVVNSDQSPFSAENYRDRQERARWVGQSGKKRHMPLYWI